MLANTTLPPEFEILDRQHKQLIEGLLDAVNMPFTVVDVESCNKGNFRAFDGARFYRVEAGSITARYRGRIVYKLEAGDMLLPDVTGTTEQDAAVFYGSESGARLHAYPAFEFLRRVFQEPAAVKLWTRMLITYSGLLVRITASFAQEEIQANPGFEIYDAGDVILRQGDPADFVFTLSSGVAEVLVDDVTVGRIEEGEIFGAMAALTNAPRSATVKAITECSVVKVAKEQFSYLIRTNPGTIQSLLSDMAHSIVNLNEQLVRARSEQ